MNLGSKIKKMREEQRFTQDYVASKLGISQAAYSKIESDTTELTLERLNQIARIYDVTAADIINANEKKSVEAFGFNNQEKSLYETLVKQLQEENRYLKEDNHYLKTLLGEANLVPKI